MKIHYVAIITLAAFLAGKFLFPQEPKVVEKIKIVEKKEQKKKEDKKITSVKIKRPDGSVETRTQVDIKSQTDTKQESVTDKKTEKGSSVTVGVLVLKDLTEFSSELEYGATVTFPLIGKLKGQAIGTTQKQVGIGIALEF